MDIIKRFIKGKSVPITPPIARGRHRDNTARAKRKKKIPTNDSTPELTEFFDKLKDSTDKGSGFEYGDW